MTDTATATEQPSPAEPPSRNYIEAKSRSEAVQKMIRTDPLLSQLYTAGKQDDGKAGWVNAIKDQSGACYRLLFYVGRLPVAAEYRDQAMYELLYGPVGDDDEPNYPRALFTMSGGINLMRDGLPGPRFVRSLLKGLLEIVPYTTTRDIKTETLRKDGFSFLCVYDRSGQGIRVLDLLQYSMVYHLPDRYEIQAHRDDALVVGETRFVRPFLLRHVTASSNSDEPTTRVAAETLLRKQSWPREAGG